MDFLHGYDKELDRLRKDRREAQSAYEELCRSLGARTRFPHIQIVEITDTPKRHKCKGCGTWVDGPRVIVGYNLNVRCPYGYGDARPLDEVKAEKATLDAQGEAAEARVAAAQHAIWDRETELRERREAPAREAEERRERRRKEREVAYHAKHPEARAEQDARLVNQLLRQISRRLNEA